MIYEDGGLVISGSIVALVTPMLDTGEVDFPALQRLVEWHIAAKTDAIVAVGTTGESATLNVDVPEGDVARNRII